MTADFQGTRGVEPPQEKADSRVIGFNASPEPVKHGKYLRFWGALQVDDESGWEGGRGKVGLYFKANGSDSYRYVKLTWSSLDGKLSTRVKAWNSGRWRFVYSGDEDTSRSDHVRVRR